MTDLDSLLDEMNAAYEANRPCLRCSQVGCNGGATCPGPERCADMHRWRTRLGNAMGTARELHEDDVMGMCA